ncbi:MAG: hypothetical protein VKK97_04460, partial [Synechococcaceae cyanobacterium]|nr:hypothetical protein [Synechococcaceae cyanobacterium]
MTFTSINAMSNSHVMADNARTRLLLQFIAHVQDTGLCSYPGLEAHLHRFAEELRSQAAEAAAAPRTAGEDTAVAASETDAEALPDNRLASGRPTPPEVTASTPASQDLEATGPDDAAAQGRDPASQEGSELNLPNRKGLSDGSRLAEHNQGQPTDGWAQSPTDQERAATERHDSPASVARADAAHADPAEAADPGDTAAAASSPSQSSFEPDLDLLLRFREQVQSSGFCDHPELQERLAAHQGNRELPQGNSRLAAERLQQRCHSQLQQTLSQLEALNQSAISLSGEGERPCSQDTAPHPDLYALMSVSTGLSQLRQLLADGVASYGLPIDAPQRRMLQRQLARAERSDRQIRRMLARAAAGPSLLAELQNLGGLLETLVGQWWPDGDASNEAIGAVPIRLRS